MKSCEDAPRRRRLPAEAIARARGATALALIGLLLLPAAAFPATDAPNARPDGEAALAREIVSLAVANHYPAVRLDEPFGHRVLENYLNALDPGRFYLTQGDAKAIHKAFDPVMAADLEKGDLSPALAAYRLYRHRVAQVRRMIRQRLRHEPSLQTSERYLASREHAVRASDSRALATLWSKRITNAAVLARLRGSDWSEARAEIEARFANPADTTGRGAVFDRYVNAFLETLDPHSRYVPADGTRGGGVHESSSTPTARTLQLVNHDGRIVIVHVLGNATHGLAAGDEILGLLPAPGKRIVYLSGWNLGAAAATLRSTTDPGARLLVRPGGASPGGDTRLVPLPAPESGSDTRHADAFVEYPRLGVSRYSIGVIRLPRFYRHAADDVAYLLRVLKRKRVTAVLLDLRGNRGGSLREALETSALFLSSGPVLQVRNRSGNTQVLDGIGKATVWNGPLAVLMNGGTASAAEILCSALHASGRALLIGSRTWGKGTIQTLVPLADGGHAADKGGIRLTSAEYFSLEGTSPQATGIEPDIAIPDNTRSLLGNEADSPDALPPVHIPALAHGHDDRIHSMLPKLRDYLSTQIESARKFQLYLEELAYWHDYYGRRYVSLNLARRRSARDGQRRRLLELDNAWRALAGLPDFDDIAEARRSHFAPPDVDFDTAVSLMGKFASLSPSVQVRLTVSPDDSSHDNCRSAQQFVPLAVGLAIDTSHGFIGVFAGCPGRGGRIRVPARPPATSPPSRTAPPGL